MPLSVTLSIPPPPSPSLFPPRPLPPSPAFFLPVSLSLPRLSLPHTPCLSLPITPLPVSVSAASGHARKHTRARRRTCANRPANASSLTFRVPVRVCARVRAVSFHLYLVIPALPHPPTPPLFPSLSFSLSLFPSPSLSRTPFLPRPLSSLKTHLFSPLCLLFPLYFCIFPISAHTDPRARTHTGPEPAEEGGAACHRLLPAPRPDPRPVPHLPCPRQGVRSHLLHSTSLFYSALISQIALFLVPARAVTHKHTDARALLLSSCSIPLSLSLVAPSLPRSLLPSRSLSLLVPPVPTPSPAPPLF